MTLHRAVRAWCRFPPSKCIFFCNSWNNVPCTALLLFSTKPSTDKAQRKDIIYKKKFTSICERTTLKKPKPHSPLPFPEIFEGSVKGNNNNYGLTDMKLRNYCIGDPLLLYYPYVLKPPTPKKKKQTKTKNPARKSTCKQKQSLHVFKHWILLLENYFFSFQNHKYLDSLTEKQQRVKIISIHDYIFPIWSIHSAKTLLWSQENKVTYHMPPLLFA